jgi:hypothetical protein
VRLSPARPRSPAGGNVAKGWGDAWRNYTGPVKDGPPSAMQPKAPTAAEADAMAHGWSKTKTVSEAEYRSQFVKAPKYHNVKTTTYDGVLCDSKREAARWEQLRAMQAAGMIADLLPHPSFPVYVNGTRTGRFTGDALYVESGKLILEDTKSRITAKHQGYRARVKVFLACYPHITFREHLT